MLEEFKSMPKSKIFQNAFEAFSYESWAGFVTFQEVKTFPTEHQEGVCYDYLLTISWQYLYFNSLFTLFIISAALIHSTKPSVQVQKYPTGLKKQNSKTHPTLLRFVDMIKLKDLHSNHSIITYPNGSTINLPTIHHVIL